MQPNEASYSTVSTVATLLLVLYEHVKNQPVEILTPRRALKVTLGTTVGLNSFAGIFCLKENLQLPLVHIFHLLTISYNAILR